MGYTHYWRQNKDIPVEKWKIITEAAQVFVSCLPGIDPGTARSTPGRKLQLTRVGFKDDDPAAPQIDAGAIRLNGAGDSENARANDEEWEYAGETFLFPRKSFGQDSFTFCKTNRRPYDLVVCAILFVVDAVAPECVKISSDGDLEDWTPAIEWVRTLQRNNQLPKELPGYGLLQNLPRFLGE